MKANSLKLMLLGLLSIGLATGCTPKKTPTPSESEPAQSEPAESDPGTSETEPGESEAEPGDSEDEGDASEFGPDDSEEESEPATSEEESEPASEEESEPASEEETEEPAGWPADDVNAFLTANGVENDVIPVLDGGNEYYTATNANELTVMVLFDDEDAAEAAKDAYIELLIENDYGVGMTDSWGDDYFVTDNYELEIGPWTYDDTLYIDVTALENLPLEAVFPAEAVAAAITETFGTTDTIPNMPNAAEFSGLYVEDGKIQVAGYYGNYYATTAALETYAAALLGAGFVEAGADAYGDMHYVNANETLDVCPWIYEDSELVVDITDPSAPFYPSEAVDAFLEDNGVTDTLPVLTADDAFEVQFIVGSATAYFDARLVIYYASFDDADLGIAGYADALLDLGYTEDGVDEYGDMFYLSANEQLRVQPWLYGAQPVVIVDIFLYEGEGGEGGESESEEEVLWPAEDIAALLGDLGYTDELPAFDGEFTAVEAYDFYGIPYIDIDFDGTEEAAMLAQLAYADTLEEAGFTYYETDPVYGDLSFLSPNEEYQAVVGIMVTGGGVYYLAVWVKPAPVAPSTTFPADTLDELVPGLKDLMPAIDGGTNYEINNVGYYIELYITFETAEEAEALFNGYGETLTTAGFTYLSDDDLYAAPDYSFLISIYDYAGTVVEIDIIPLI